MRHTFLFLAILCATRLTPCLGSEFSSADHGSSDSNSNNALKKKAVLPSVSVREKKDTGSVAKADVRALSVAEGLALAQKSNCLACHSIDKKVIGPAWMDVSKRYKGVAGMEDRLVVKVSTGGYGNWGNMPMPALAPEVKEKDIRTLARFILGLAK